MLPLVAPESQGDRLNPTDPPVNATGRSSSVGAPGRFERVLDPFGTDEEMERRRAVTPGGL